MAQNPVLRARTVNVEAHFHLNSDPIEEEYRL